MRPVDLNDRRILLTGAGGGIGRHLVARLVGQGARLTLVDRDTAGLQALLDAHGAGRIHVVPADITSSAERARSVALAREHLGGIDILVNAAGVNPFGAYAGQDEAQLQRTVEINLLAPMLLTRAVLPDMLAQGSGQVVNIGSTFGSIGFAWFTAYSASKFGLRGFSQALRRELEGTGIHVTYIAPRAVRTAINSQQVYAMARAVGMNLDEAEPVAGHILQAIRQRRKECYIGFPESLFVRINALSPGLVDRAVRGQNRVAGKFASDAGK